MPTQAEASPAVALRDGQREKSALPQPVDIIRGELSVAVKPCGVRSERRTERLERFVVGGRGPGDMVHERRCPVLWRRYSPFCCGRQPFSPLQNVY